MSNIETKRDIIKETSLKLGTMSLKTTNKNNEEYHFDLHRDTYMTWVGASMVCLSLEDLRNLKELIENTLNNDVV